MRNVDKIKALENQNESLKRQKDRLSRDKDTLVKANKEIQAANNAVMIAVALEYGKRSDDNTYSLILDKIDVVKNLSLYDISTVADGDKRIVTVKPKNSEESI